MEIQQMIRGILFVGAMLSNLALGENWPQWRGPFFNGSTTETGLPASCGPGMIRWTTPLSGPSHATPIVWADRIFLSATDPDSRGLLGLSIRVSDGQILWQQRLGVEARAPRNNGATPSAVTDGQRIYFLFGSGDLAALDWQGQVLWSRNLVADYGNLSTKFGYSSSPLLWQGRLYILLLRRPKPYYGPAGIEEPLPSYLLAIDPETGRDLWQYQRKTGARDESCESYATAIPFLAGEHWEILVQGGDCLTAHDPTSGREFWRFEYNPNRKTNWRLIPSPATFGPWIFMTMPRGGPLLAMQAGGSGRLGSEAVVWTFDERTSDSGTPLVYASALYVLQSDKNDPWTRSSKSSPAIFLFKLDPTTGREIWRCRLADRGAWRASPTGADGKVYCLSEEGEVVVVSAGTQGTILSRTLFDDGPACATIAIAHSCLFIRTANQLVCVGNHGDR